MTLFYLKAYWKYLCTAKSKYKIHSPFVFDFVVNVLENSKSKIQNSRHHNVAQYIKTYYKFTNINIIEKIEEYKRLDNSIDILCLDSLFWVHVLNNYKTLQKSKGCNIIPNIHTNTVNEACWNEIIKQETIFLSIDVFHSGILFFSNDFKVKQHFILKY